MKRAAMINRIQLVVNAGSSAETIRPAAKAPPQITGARNSLIMGSFSVKEETNEQWFRFGMRNPYGENNL
jgi:hypothetical protein